MRRWLSYWPRITIPSGEAAPRSAVAPDALHVVLLLRDGRDDSAADETLLR